ncbi:ATPase [Alkalidesulfovibrio alkalitolerans DSM 16529]|uniref:ATPase n=2 Tax=Alkalidesulfovibrio alkalitolerans TaxID=293256 RepID=S7UQ76_9BACT|nr:ATPase [Alkalidesulfovibrio alkalitolerans DSM 16529]
MPNPFRLETIRPGQPFCDREEETRVLLAHARDFRNVVLSSPRRYGKTSLALRVQSQLESEGWACLHADFFGVDSMEDVARRIGRALLKALDRRETLLGKGRRLLKGLKAFRPAFHPREDGGITLTVERVSESGDPVRLLENVLEDLAEVVGRKEFSLHVTFDEFQEVTRLKESGQIEGIIRTCIQGQDASYLFLGSRRGVLRAIFNERKRPLFQSAIHMQLDPLPYADVVPFVENLFKQEGKSITTEGAKAVHALVEGYPYYVQRLAGEAFEAAEGPVSREDVVRALARVAHGERYGFQAVLSTLTPSQIKVLRALTKHPTSEPQSAEFTALSGTPASSVGFAIKKLESEDLIEKDARGVWRVVDPVFRLWLNEL